MFHFQYSLTIVFTVICLSSINVSVDALESELVLAQSENGTSYQYNYSAAKTYCDILNKNSMTEDIGKMYKQSVSLMKRNNLTDMWMPVIKEDLGNWENVNGTENSHFKVYNWRNNGQLTECAVIDRRTGHLEVDNCESKGKGYVCHIECQECPISVTSYNCLRENGGCYIIGCDAGNWYGARSLCRNMDGSLVFVGNVHSAQQIRQAIGTLGIRSCDSFWLGVRHSDWFIDKTGTRKTILYRSLWYDGQPESVPGKRCAVLHRFYKGYYMLSSGCGKRYPFACQTVTHDTAAYTTQSSCSCASGYDTTEPSTVTASVHSELCKSSVAWIIPLSLLPSAVLMVLLVILLYQFYSKYTNGSIKSESATVTASLHTGSMIIDHTGQNYESELCECSSMMEVKPRESTSSSYIPFYVPSTDRYIKCFPRCVSIGIF